MEGREGKESAPLDLNPGDATAKNLPCQPASLNTMLRDVIVGVYFSV